MNETMTIESFFLNDYLRLRNENDELKAVIQEHELERAASHTDCGFTDLGKGIEALKVETASYYSTFDKETPWGNLDIEELKTIAEMETEALIEEARNTKQKWSGFVYEEEKRTFPFTVEFTTYKGRVPYAYDPDYSRTSLIKIRESAGIGCWVNATLEENCRNEAAENIRDMISSRIKEIGKEQAGEQEEGEK